MREKHNSSDPWWRSEWPWISYLAIFLIAFVVLLVLEASPIFADPDSYYHVKMALLLRDNGIISSFPWLQLTTLGQSYTDQHLLYHLILIPFVTIFPPLIGMKVATVMFGSSLITAVYWFLRSFRVKWAFFYPVILLFIRPFTFRIGLAKAPSTSLIFLIVGLAWVFRYQLRRLFAIAFTYVWYYGGFALLGVAAAVSAGVSYLINRIKHRPAAERLATNIRALVSRRQSGHGKFSLNWAVLLVVAGGLLAGVVFNPYFPANLKFYEQQLVNIGIINFRNVIGVGAEWYSYDFGELVANGAFASLLVLLAALGLIFRAKAQSKKSWTLLVLMVFFLVLTLKSRRYVEYYIPFAVLFAAFSISDSLNGPTGRRIWIEARGLIKHTWWGRVLGVILGLYFAVGIGYVAGRDFSSVYRDLRSGYRFDELGPASRWLAENTPAGARVVHSDWDEFPLLFYHNSHNTYIAGLDPTFLYKANQDTYWTWVNITLGKYSGDVYAAVTGKLGARYVLLTHDHVGMEALIRGDSRFKQVYEDSEAVIFAAQMTTQ